MSKSRLGWVGTFTALGTFVVVLVAFVAPGCGPPGDPLITAPGSKPERANAGGGGGDLKVLAAGNGVLKGRVTLKGARPDTAQMSVSLLEEMKKNSDKDICLMGSPEELSQQVWKIDDKG